MLGACQMDVALPTTVSSYAATCPTDARSVVLLAAAPLFRDDVVLVHDVSRDIVQILLLHGTHLWPQISGDDGWMDLGNVCQAIVSHGSVEVRHQRIDVVAGRESARELLHAQADVLIGARAAADVADGARCIEQTLAADELFLGQIHGLALAIDRDG